MPIIERTQPLKAFHACVLFQNVVEGNGEVCFRNVVKEFSKNVIAAPQRVFLLCLERPMIDTDGDTVLFKNGVLNLCEVLADMQQVVLSLFANPLLCFGTAALIRVLLICSLKKLLRCSFLLPFLCVDLARREHDVNVRLPLPGGKRTDLFMNRPRIVMIREVFGEKCVEDFFLLRKV